MQRCGSRSIALPKPGGSNAGLLIDWALGESHPNSVTVMGNLSNPSPGRASAQTIEQQAYADEEDHLLYVALTRARYSIHLSGSEKRGANKGWYERLLPFASLVHNTWPTFESAINASDEARQGPAQIELAGLFDPPAVWVRPQFPVLKALNAPVGKVVPRITTPELRKGTAWHAALQLRTPGAHPAHGGKLTNVQLLADRAIDARSRGAHGWRRRDVATRSRLPGD